MKRSRDFEIGRTKVGLTWRKRRNFKVGRGPRGVIGKSLNGPIWYRERFLYLGLLTISIGRSVGDDPRKAAAR
jgi:hypothetical protein